MSRKEKKKAPHSPRDEKATSPVAEIRKVPRGARASIRAADAPTSQSLGSWDWLFAAVLILAVVLVYQPAWQGGLLWDDDFHVTRPELRSWHGLYRIWCDVHATLQYYPILHSAFWVEHKLWGDATLGYHLVKIFSALRGGADGGNPLAAAGDPGGVPGRGHLRTAPRAGGIGGLDRGAKEHPLRRLLPGRRDGLPPLRPNADSSLVLGGLGPFHAGAVEQVRDGHPSRGAVGGLLVAAGTVVVEARRAALAALLPLGGRHGDDHGMVGTGVQQVLRAGVRVHARPADSDRGTGGLVSSGKAFLAGQPDLYLPALAGRFSGVVAVPVSAGRGGLVGRDLGDAASDACPAGGPLVFWRDTLPGDGVLQPVHVPLFARRRPLPVPGMPGDHDLILGRRGLAAPARRGLGRGCWARRAAWRCCPYSLS